MGPSREKDLLQQSLAHNNKGGGYQSDTATFPSQLSNSNFLGSKGKQERF